MENMNPEMEPLNEEEVVQNKTKSEKSIDRIEQAKKKKTLKIVIASVASVILLVLLVGLINYGSTGSFIPKEWSEYFYNQKIEKEMEKVVVTMGDAKLTNGLLQIYYWSNVQDYMTYGPSSGLTVPKKNTPFSEQIYDEKTGKTWEQYFLEEAVLNWRQFQAVSLEAKKVGFELSQETKDEVTALSTELYQTASKYGYRDVDHLLSQTLGDGATFDNFITYIWQYYTTIDYWQTIVDDIKLTDEQLEEYFDTNAEQIKKDTGLTKETGKLVDVRHILIVPEGGKYDAEKKETVYTEDEWEKGREAAQEVYDEWLNGEHTEESFAKLAEKKSEDGGSASNGGLYSWVGKGEMVKEFEDWCFDESRKVGDHGMVRTKFGYHIMYFVFADEAWYRYSEIAAVDAAASEKMDVLLEGYPFTANYDVAFLCEVDL